MDEATVDVYVGYVNLPSSCERPGIEAYSAWASALLVQPQWAMLEPQNVGRVTSTDSRASFYVHDKTIKQTLSLSGASGIVNLGKNYAVFYFK